MESTFILLEEIREVLKLSVLLLGDTFPKENGVQEPFSSSLVLITGLKAPSGLGTNPFFAFTAPSAAPMLTGYYALIMSDDFV